MATLKLTPYVAGVRSTDLDRTNNRSAIITGDEEIAQRIRMTLQAQFGECAYNKNGGTPYLEFRDTDDQSIRAMVAETVRGVTGVRDVIECSAVSEVVDGNREIAVSGKAQTISGATIPFNTTGAS